ncbi:MAG: DNA cytosine methyltransferase [Eubacteriales bacterium]|nr:DNA cytosine methyltransferase [Eubacteriales bacterium]
MKNEKKRDGGQINFLDEIIVDNFAGGGGASTGMELATGRPVAIAINHDPDAILMHKTNHPYTEHLQASVWDVDPQKVCGGRPVGLAWFSPDCKHFSKAKGAALVDRNIRGLAWIVLRWAGTVRPRVIILENVEEFVTWGPVRKGKPVKKKAGQTFQKWKRQLLELGYRVEHREIVAADLGAPTTRKRFVLIARCDGQPIIWPERTHGPRDSAEVQAGRLLPWKSAAEIIDWSVPCYSVFASKRELKEKYGVNAVRPLAENTMRRIIRGVDKFTIRSGRPFIVECNHAGAGHMKDPAYPLGTVLAKHTGGIVAPSLIQYHTEQTENVRANGVGLPLPTVDASNRYGLTVAQLVEYFGNGQPIDVRKPMHTVTSHDREAVVCAHISKYYGGVIGADASEPLPTVTAVDHNALTAAHIVEFKGQDIGQDQRKPLRTITASAGEFAECRTELIKAGRNELGHWPEVRAMLNRHCGYEMADDEILLLEIGGVHYFIADILLRMLTPRELYNAMGFPPDYIIDRDYLGNEYGKTKQVARCGNAVCPPMATALVRANLPEWCNRTITTMEELEKAVTA